MKYTDINTITGVSFDEYLAQKIETPVFFGDTDSNEEWEGISNDFFTRLNDALIDYEISFDGIDFEGPYLQAWSSIAEIVGYDPRLDGAVQLIKIILGKVPGWSD
jgi:hypothetical protein